MLAAAADVSFGALVCAWARDTFFDQGKATSHTLRDRLYQEAVLCFCVLCLEVLALLQGGSAGLSGDAGYQLGPFDVPTEVLDGMVGGRSIQCAVRR